MITEISVAHSNHYTSANLTFCVRQQLLLHHQQEQLRNLQIQLHQVLNINSPHFEEVLWFNDLRFDFPICPSSVLTIQVDIHLQEPEDPKTYPQLIMAHPAGIPSSYRFLWYLFWQQHTCQLSQHTDSIFGRFPICYFLLVCQLSLFNHLLLLSFLSLKGSIYSFVTPTGIHCFV